MQLAVCVCVGAGCVEGRKRREEGEREAGRERKQVIARERGSPVFVGTILYHTFERGACCPIDLIRHIFGFTCIFVLLSIIHTHTHTHTPHTHTPASAPPPFPSTLYRKVRRSGIFARRAST